jgi:hypothetical protein
VAETAAERKQHQRRDELIGEDGDHHPDDPEQWAGQLEPARRHRHRQAGQGAADPARPDRLIGEQVDQQTDPEPHPGGT